MLYFPFAYDLLVKILFVRSTKKAVKSYFLQAKRTALVDYPPLSEANGRQDLIYCLYVVTQGGLTLGYRLSFLIQEYSKDISQGLNKWRGSGKARGPTSRTGKPQEENRIRNVAKVFGKGSEILMWTI